MGILKFEVGIVLTNIIDHLQKTPDSRLMLVKDSGIYICSLPSPGPAKVLYADGCDPNSECEAQRQEVYDRCRALVGGDDFADDIPLEWLLMAKDFQWRWLQVRIDENQLVLVNGNGSRIPEIFNNGGRKDGK